MASSIKTFGRPIRELQADDRVFLLFHGRHGTALEMEQLSARLARPTDATLIPLTPGGGWYPLSIYSPLGQNQPMLAQSLERIETILHILEEQSVQSSRIVLAGFSQGASLVAQFLLQYPARYAAAMIFSGGALGTDDELIVQAGSLERTLVLISASRADPYIQWSRVAKTASLLRGMNAEVTLQGYEEASHALTPMDYLAAVALLDQSSRRS